MSSTTSVITPRPARDERRRPLGTWLPLALAPVIAVAIVVVALDEGGTPVSTRSVAAILVWWGLLVGVVFTLVQPVPIPRVALWCGGLLLALAVWAGISIGWAPSAERAFEEMDRLLLYAGILLLPIAFARRAHAGRWMDGLALAIAVVGLLALAQRLFPGLLPSPNIASVLPGAKTRLQYPLGYWNGLASFLGLGVPLLLRSAVAARTWPWRAAALAPLPALAAAIYLTSSRGGVAVALLGAVVFVALAGERMRALFALVLAGLGSLGAVAAVSAHTVLEDGPFDSPAAHSAGREAAAIVIGACLVAGLAYAAIAARTPARLRIHPLVWAGAALVLVAALALADPAARIKEFKAPPPPGASSFGVSSHLSSGAGSGRWQFWSAAVDQFRAHPFKGGGAGSYEPWWAQHGSIDWFVRNAHSLWLETLGELGIVGFVLLVAAFVLGFAAGIGRLRRSSSAERTTLAALLAVLAAFVLGSALDWIWQLPAIAAVAMIALGLLVGPATVPAATATARAVRAGDTPHAAARRFGARAAVAVAAWVVIVAAAIPLLVSQQLDASRAAASRGDLTEALDRARNAEAIQPWAASPRLQLALAHEETGRLDLARGDIAAAIERDSADWRLQLVAARLATKAGDIPAARLALKRVRELNPRSRLLRTTR
jgi:O-antigen ligase